MEEATRLKKEKERQEIERKTREAFAQMALAEEEEARKAEMLVRRLEAKEKEWISKLQGTQRVQEQAFRYLEDSLMRDAEVAATTIRSVSTKNIHGGSPSRRLKSGGGDGNGSACGFPESDVTGSISTVASAEIAFAN